MKKTLYILAVLFCTAACSKQYVEPVMEMAEASDAAPTVTITFDVEVPEALETRSTTMANTPNIESLWVIEFGASGYYKGWHECIPTNNHVTGNGESAKKQFKVELPISDNDQTFHFIANPPSRNSYLNQTEINVLNSMSTTNGNAAFWQRIKVVGGVRGEKQTDGTYIPTTATSALFSTIPLIRNFAKVSVFASDNAPDIEIVKFALVNVPNSGSVAPYDSKTFDFAAPYMNVSDLNLDKLSGYAPGDVEIDVPTQASSLKWAAAGESLFMYERPTPSEDPTCVIVEAKNGGNTYFYKIELMNGLSYVPIYRDFEYKINMAAVGTEAGETTAQKALDNAPFGDVSANLETASLTQISDGTSTLYVSFTDYTHVLDGTETSDPKYTLYYKFDSNPYSLTADLEGTNAVKSVGTEYDASGDYAGWKAVDLTLNKAATGIAKSLITVTGTAEGARPLYRKVYVRVMGTQDLSVAVSGSSSTLGSPISVDVTIPEDLGASLFPVTLYIEAENNSLTSNDSKLSALTGPSKFSSKSGKNTFYFVRTVSYSEYQSNNTISCAFKTNKANAATAIKVYTDRYFNPADGNLE